MIEADSIVWFLYLEYLGSSEFIGKKLSAVKSTADLDQVVSDSVKDMAKSHGYKLGSTEYSKFVSIVRNAIRNNSAFKIQQHQYFGEMISFDIDKYRTLVTGLKVSEYYQIQGSSATGVSYLTTEKYSYHSVENLVAKYGKSGLGNAIEEVAEEHAWIRNEDSADSHQKREKSGTGSKVEVSSTSWTGVRQQYQISETQQNRIAEGIRELETVIHQSELSQEEKSQALAYTFAALAISEAPEPTWDIVKELLVLIAAISGTLSLALKIAEMI